MASNLGNLAATVSLNIDPFQTSARVLATQMRSIDRAMKAQETNFKNNSKNIGAQKAQYDLTGKAIGNYTNLLEMQRKKYADLKTEIGDVNSATVQQKTDLLSAEAAINKTVGEIEKLTGKYNELGRQIAISESNWTKSGKVLESFGDRTRKIGESLDSFGNKWTVGVTAPIVTGAGFIAKAAMDWESAFAGVMKTNDEVIDSSGKVVYSYADLEAGLRGLAKELPATHAEIAGVAEAAGQLGIQTENVTSFTKTMIDLGESTNMSAEEAATALARFANITQMSQGDFDKLGSVIVDLGNNFATTESEITAMGLRLAAAGSQIGMSEAEIMSFATALSSVGVEAEAGGTAFSKVMIQMQLAAENGAGAFDELEAMANNAGYSLKDVVVAVQDGGKNLNSFASELGTSGKNLKAMYKEADKSATSLENFAKVAGLTNAEFAEMFKTDPSKAIMKFVDGLASAEERGTSAIKVLEDMDIKEVRLRDSLLRAAGASDVFGDALARGNKAWGENSALTEEASKRYATTESQLKMLRNEVVDVAIEFGGPLLQALRDGVQAAKPFISTISDLATAFSNANPETQQAILKYVGLAAAIGPASKMLGGFLKLTGGGISTIGKIAQGVGKLSGTYKASKGAIDIATTATATYAKGAIATGANLGTLTTAVGWATTSLGGYAGVLGALTSPAGIAVAAIAGVTAAVIVGKKAYEDYQLSGGKWGFEVTKEQDKVIEKSLQLRDEATAHVNAFADGIQESADKAIEANRAIVDSIQQTIDKEHERATKKAEQIENEDIQNELKKQADRDKRINEQSMRYAQERVDGINNILSEASKHNRSLSDSERRYLAENYKQLTAEQLEVAGFTKEQILSIETAYQTNLNKMSRSQLREREQAVHDALYKEQKAYEETQQTIIDGTKNNATLQKELLDKAETDHKAKTESMILGYAKLGKALGFTLEDMSETWKQFGWTVDEVQALLTASIGDVNNSVDMLAQGTEKADMMWNDMAFDPKTGEVRTNMADVLVDMAKTDEGWEQLQFMAKNADLTTNAKEEIAIAIGEAGRWNDMSFVDKKALVDNDEAMFNLYESIDKLGMWNEYNTDRKELGIDNADVAWKLAESNGLLQQWNEISIEDKKLLAENEELLNVVLSSEESLNRWNQIPAESKTLLADNTDFLTRMMNSETLLNQWNELPVGDKHILAENSDLLNTVFQSEESLNLWNSLPVEVKAMVANNDNLVSKLNDGTISIEMYNQVLPILKQLLGDESSIVSATGKGVNAVEEYIRKNAPDKYLRGDASSAQRASQQGIGAINNWNGKYVLPKTVTVSANTWGATAAQAAINSVRGKTVFIDIVRRGGGSVAGKAYAKGTPYHTGGLAVLGDGGKEEPYLTPQGEFGISPAVDTVYDLPMGTKVWSSISKFMQTLPHFNQGTQFDDTKISRMNFGSFNRQQEQREPRRTNNRPMVNIEKIIWNGKEDIRKTMQEMGWIVDVDERGQMA